MTKRTFTIDLESYSQPCVLGNVSGGIQPGEMMIFTAGRRTGKSMYTQMLKNRIYDTNLCKEIVLPMFATKPKYQFSRAKWYTADFNSKHYDEVRAWCTHHFGKEDKVHNAWSRWKHIYEDRIFFRDEKDYMMFVLRWS